MRASERGFTLLEMMFVLVIVAILIAVALPMFTAETRKTNANAEVNAMFAELSAKEEQYKLDQGVYLAAVACPPAPTQFGQAGAFCVATGTPWDNLKVKLPVTNLYCSYTITAGLKAAVPAPPAPFAMAQPATGWYFITASCDMDGNGTFSTYFMNSVDPSTQVNNEGE
jgi:prepilin-type N-terminal cleavage/methylation domain-containing protein